MKLTLTRTTYTKRSTIGELKVDGVFECHTLEDPVRPVKIKGDTAIPAGTYRVDITWSPRFQQDMPLLENVPGFEGIRIHTGNTPDHTEGCILVGRTKAVDSIGSSKDAYTALFARLKAALKAGQKVDIEVIEGGLSPHMPQSVKKDAAPAQPAAAGVTYRITADPLRMRSGEDGQKADNIVARLPLGTLATTTGRTAKTGWLHVRATVDGGAKEGFISGEHAEAVPAPPPAPAAAKPVKTEELYRVNASSLNLRKEPADMADEAILAALPRGHLVAKVEVMKKAGWWKVRTILHGKSLEGHVLSTLLAPDSPASAAAATPASPAPVITTSGVQVTEKALQLILSFEGLDQPGKWPGESSGISLGRGYDLGYHTHDQFQGDWGPHLSAAQMQRLAKAVGKRGLAAKNMAPDFADIHITTAAADEVFTRSTLPRIKANTLIAFPGVTALPPDAQGALASLVYNRGTSMDPTSDKRKEMREVRDHIASTTLPMPQKLQKIADSILAMQRHWPDTPGLRRRRRAEAALVASCI